MSESPHDIVTEPTEHISVGVFEGALSAGDLTPQGVTYVMEDIVRLEFTLGRTKLTLTGPEDETDNARILVEGAKDLFLQAVVAEQEKSEVLVSADHEADYEDDYDLHWEEGGTR